MDRDRRHGTTPHTTAGRRAPYQWEATWIAALVVLFGVLTPHAAQGEVVEDFEGTRPTWQLAGGDAPVHLQAHQRVDQQAVRGERCEYLRVQAGSGSHVYATHAVGRARVIDELAPSVWLRSDRAGLQFMVRVVLPRSVDPQTGQPATTLVRGELYRNVGKWQRLTVPRLPQQLMEQVRMLRLQLGSAVDTNEAYVDLACLNVYGGRGVTNVWTDDLELTGFVAAEPTPAATRKAAPSPVAAPSAIGPQHGMLGSKLLVDGRPVFPRIIEHQGESFALLKQLGFNTVQLRAPPTVAQLAEAQQAGLWLFCPPPPQIDQADRVLAWNLGEDLSVEHLDQTRRWCDTVRRTDPRGARPLIGSVDSGTRLFSRHLDVLRFAAPPPGGSFEWGQLLTHFETQPRLARPGTPFWADVPTEASEGLARQLAALSPHGAWPAVVEPEQMRLAAFSAVAAGARGLCFRSRSRLDATNAVGRLRAATVELINRELAALEPWAAGGAGAAGVATSVDDVRVAVISTERSRLLIPLHAPDNAQHACGAPPPGEVAFVVPGVPDDFNAYELTPAGLRPLRRQRWPGGVRITRDGSQLGWPVVLTQDPLVVSRLARDLTANGPRLSRLRRELAAGWLQLAQQVAQQLPTKGDEQIDVAPLLAQAESHLRQADQLLAHGDDAAAAQAADRALQNLAQVRRALWQRHAAEFPDPLASPCCVQFSTLPSHRQLAATLRAGRGGPNLLPGGDFENLQQMLSAGWQQVQTPADGVKTHVELTRQAPVAGQYVLRLSAWVDDGSAQNRVVETLPVHVTSAPATVHPGQVVRIHGWVRIAEPIAGSGHGLVISDSLAGDDLALRINATGSWREFTLYRAAEQSGQVTITFALTGLGVVDLDQVTITTITPAPLAAQPRSPGR